MSVLVVGNILKDIYLNLDGRTEKFETDQHGTEWLDLGFNASEHHFFNRGSSFGGAAITLEVFEKMGIFASIAEHPTPRTADIYRYILVGNHGVSYLAPNNLKSAHFTPPTTAYDYLFIDRSANLDSHTSRKIYDYLTSVPDTKLVLYIKDYHNLPDKSLIDRADLLFIERQSAPVAEKPYAPELSAVPSSKIIYLSEKSLNYQDITEPLSLSHIDKMTHLSLYSIASATILSCFILGKSVEESLSLARTNVENSHLDATLSLDELTSFHPSPDEDLNLIAANLMLKGKGILAADESGGNIHQKFTALNIPDTPNTRRDYRNIFLSTPNLHHYLNGVLLFDETTRQSTDSGQNFIDHLIANRIVPGIKVDQGLAKFPGSSETFTKGLDGLSQRLSAYHTAGLRFAKWRAAFEIHLDSNGQFLTPTDYAIDENCRILTEYAKKCQAANIVPIIEPEVVYNGDYTIDESATVTGRIFDALFAKLILSGVNLRACILKCNMVIAGKNSAHPSTPEEVGLATARILKSHVPKALAGVVFLSGGQSPEQATDNLAEIIKNGPFPWPVSFSFARALQEPALHAWAGDNNNIKKARQAFLDRLIANTDALNQTPTS